MQFVEESVKEKLMKMVLKNLVCIQCSEKRFHVESIESEWVMCALTLNCAHGDSLPYFVFRSSLDNFCQLQRT